MEHSDFDRDIRKKQITSMVRSIYNDYEFLHDESLESLISKALKKFLDSDLSIEKIQNEIMTIVGKRKEMFDKRYDKNQVAINHKEIYSKLNDLVIELEKEDVDYQLAGALCGYIKYGVESDRCHDDIDININEKDIGKLKDVCIKLGLDFQDNRLSSPRVLKDGITVGEHEVIATSKDSSFHIGAFPFERLADGTIITKGYYHDDNNNPCCREEIISSNLAKEFFGKEKVQFNGHTLYITSPEYVYILKKYTHKQKDIHDIVFLDEKIDHSKVDRINKLSDTERVVQCIQVTSLPPVEESSIEKEKKALLNAMVEDAHHDEELDKEDKLFKNDVKVISKKKKNEHGAVGVFSISIIILVVVSIVLIGLIIYTIIK